MNSQELLLSRKLRLTKPRQLVLEVFKSKTGKAVSIKTLIELIESEIDKVTLYRTLHTFEDHGLIHRIFDDSGIEKYALCVGTCENHEDDHNHSHVHFKCEKCLETECISEIQLPPIHLPKGYQAKATNFVIIGNCQKCSA